MSFSITGPISLLKALFADNVSKSAAQRTGSIDEKSPSLFKMSPAPTSKLLAAMEVDPLTPPVLFAEAPGAPTEAAAPAQTIESERRERSRSPRGDGANAEGASSDAH